MDGSRKRPRSLRGPAWLRTGAVDVERRIADDGARANPEPVIEGVRALVRPRVSRAAYAPEQIRAMVPAFLETQRRFGIAPHDATAAAAARFGVPQIEIERIAHARELEDAKRGARAEVLERWTIEAGLASSPEDAPRIVAEVATREAAPDELRAWMVKAGLVRADEVT